MHRVPELMLADGQPDLPFMLSWANEPWERRWSGDADAEGEILIDQEYGDEADWKEHFEYLLPFFRHPNYIRVNGQPAFAIYRIGHFGSTLPQIVRLWRQLAQAAGLPGLHIIATVGNFANEEGTDENYAAVDAAFHFSPQLQAVYGTGYNSRPRSVGTTNTDLPGPVPKTQYWGANTGFDKRPRGGDAPPLKVTPEDLRHAVSASFERMAGTPQRWAEPNLFFVTAWNEWNEQATLEPDDEHGAGFLNAFRQALLGCAARDLVRWGDIVDPPPTLTTEPTSDELLCYARRYPDIAAAFGNDTKALLRHYHTTGKAEGRDVHCTM